ncbi:enoyl-CoA hydratase [Ureibacillus terrenus]|uniref:Enoyl-CoA hydratase n=1 Tax=Ureibacillus terrenus TaxID=118246 RepID=A0A540V1Y5_9BACL|nr:enoyl-CoA hydratase [Ureibacillus terrenus]MED3661070.1 enoyl-CoA hydratase [Ureibacillus terrenus]MED3763358.1 enoyl-CoA hydratase [Ureibacillus terrenus]TQE90772.1 enoyl-CoA hydratase [Ureibacillus terrenus]
MNFETIELNYQDRKAVLTLKRPEAMNAMNETMLKELAECFEQLKGEQNIQVLVLKGEGRAFSAGGDIKMMLQSDEIGDFHGIMESISKMVLDFYQLPMITIAQVHGAAAGLGFSLAISCDYVVAEENSKLAMNFIGIGLVPDGGGHFFMKERTGIPKAKQIIWEGKIMNGQEAQQLGLVDIVAKDGEAEHYVEEMVKKLLSSPILAMLETKQLYHSERLNELKKVLSKELDAQLKMRQTKDHLEGIKAFVEKRPPKFLGQ